MPSCKGMTEISLRPTSSSEQDLQSYPDWISFLAQWLLIAKSRGMAWILEPRIVNDKYIKLARRIQVSGWKNHCSPKSGELHLSGLLFSTLCKTPSSGGFCLSSQASHLTGIAPCMKHQTSFDARFGAKIVSLDDHMFTVWQPTNQMTSIFSIYNIGERSKTAWLWFKTSNTVDDETLNERFDPSNVQCCLFFSPHIAHPAWIM